MLCVWTPPDAEVLSFFVESEAARACVVRVVCPRRSFMMKRANTQIQPLSSELDMNVLDDSRTVSVTLAVYRFRDIRILWIFQHRTAVFVRKLLVLFFTAS